jgi:hypothetical protein
MAAVVIKEVAGTRAIITIIIKIYMKQKFFPLSLRLACASFCLIIIFPLLPLLPLLSCSPSSKAKDDQGKQMFKLK